MVPAPAGGASGTPAKSTLFCPSCGHASPPDGDWLRVATPAGTVYRCPRCGTAVTTRPAPGDGAGRDCRPRAE